MITLNRITFKNFKIFGEEPYTINFEDYRLVLLDGPNGYGKTSVFDGIELGLTGELIRLVSLDGRQNPTDVVVAHQGKEHVEIELEFKDSDSKVKIFKRKLKQSVPNSSKKISRFAELWELYEIVDGQPVSTSQSALDQYLDSNDFKRDFHLFHYIQQEDTSRFLKGNSETQRAEKLAQLFGDTREADEKLNKLIDILGKVKTSEKAKSKEIDTIKQLYKIDESTNIATGASEPHAYALPWLAEANKSPFWDNIEIPELNQDKLNSSLAEIINIKNFLKHQRYFLRSRIFENAIRQREVLESYVGYFNSINDHDLHVTRSQKYQIIKSFEVTLRSGDPKKIFTVKNIDTIFQTLGFEDGDAFKSALQSLIEQERKANGLSSIYSELIKHHNAMSAGLQKIPDESSCLLCGQDYQSHDSLSQVISQHGDLLRSELTGQDKVLVASRDIFHSTYTSPLVKACEVYLEQISPPSQEDLLALSKALYMTERFGKLRGWLLSEGIQHDDLLATNFPVEGGRNNIVEATEHLCERIRSAIGTAPDNYYETNGENIFDRIYRDYFNSQNVKLDQVSIAQLDQKEIYIKSLYFSSLKEISERFTKLLSEQKLLGRAMIDLGDLIKILQKKIKQYRKQLITDIEIPFYIYSGKILQSHQAGLGQGIFIKDPTGDDELKNVRLVSNWESDHDILNTMSSGQVSAVVIALTLALHKVYASNFGSILIDDPVQTMDDINMSSLVEVLRNDFKGKQVILSTHEAKVARYFTYKYLKHNENVKIVNLMQRKEHVPSNKFQYRTVTDK
ncbi:chromosome segregation protein SMC [Photobacterium leiognathi subsp. mandapamensis]|nr:chromosome segregation protein SMC [Photobacterium leiognathi subsp. mandapamensis]